MGFCYTEKIDIFYLEMENSQTKLPYFYDNMILEILRTRNITPPFYKFLTWKSIRLYRLFWCNKGADDMKKLTIKQQRFADEYIISGNATQAAIKAGYSEKTSTVIGAENLTKPNIKAYIDERMKQLEEEAIADQAEVLKYLTRVLRDEEREEVLVNVGNFEQKIQSMKVSTKDKIKAAELLGKRYGSWTDKVDLSSDLTLIFEDDYGD